MYINLSYVLAVIECKQFTSVSISVPRDISMCCLIHFVYLPFPGVEAEKGVGGIYQVLPENQAAVVPGVAPAAGPTAKECV